MKLELAIQRLRRNSQAFHSLLGGLGQDHHDKQVVRWTPAPGKWSLLQLVNHLADEEREDFKVRLDHVLHKPGVEWPSIDPEGWVESRDYAAQDYGPSLERFLAERQRSLEWLGTLSDPDWSASYNHPAFGTLRAGDLMASWVAHDHLHMRQALGLMQGSLCAAVEPYSTDYAGTW
jgi:hypothetical protein